MRYLRLLFIKSRRRVRGLWTRPEKSTYRPVILITGCGSGLGLAIASSLYRQEDYRLVITSRANSQTQLKTLFKESDRIMVRELDVNSAEHRERLTYEVLERWGGVDILVNNAGISYRAVVEHMSELDELMQMQTNYLGPMAMIRLVIPHMRLNGRGKIINISSVSGMLAMPTMASYSASKHALEGASEALWYEMRPLGINVSLIQPGFIRSKSFQNVYYSQQAKNAQSSTNPYHDYYKNMTPFVERMMNRSWTTPEHIARTVLRVIRTENPPLWVAATYDATIFYYLRRLMPRRWLLPFLFYCLPGASHWADSYTKRRS